ncbi:MAG TPA: folylpolyglutamate synthase/dihydrofolate synthase family protein [Anaerovoracaceae bacterium]|nr:folylpolyglutamate synthase/dihydrofolate synthase family protein [Anaerovoracaceae bacterium]
MTYQETLDRIHSFQKYGSKLGLERMTRLMELMGNPQENMKVIHVAGTNGKGSVCRYLYSVLQENGYKTGMYTSPFLERFTERIEYNGSEISEEDLIQYTDQVLKMVDIMMEGGMESPTEFELITAIAFLYFSKQDMDFLILEVGLGGTGDSTNMVSRPVASVITSISFDHMEYLGDTLEKIAIEKAGIIKPGVPVIINVEDQNASAAIREIADTRGSKIYEVHANDLQVLEKTVDGYTFNVEIEDIVYTGLSISMIGNHQIGNAICALTVIEVLKKKELVRLDPAKLYSGFRKAKQTGRFELLQKEPFVIIDGAHNEAGAEALRMVIAEHFPDRRILMIVGMLADKKIDKLLDQFEMIADEFIATEPDNPRKLPATELCKQITKRGKKCTAIENPEDACHYAEKIASSFDVIVYAGSLYLVGKIRGLLNHEEE